MRSVSIHEAKTHLSRLVEEAAQGESFIIAKAGRPLVKVVPLEAGEPAVKQRIGFLKDAGIRIPDDFDTMSQDETERMFHGGEVWASSSLIPDC